MSETDHLLRELIGEVRALRRAISASQPKAEASADFTREFAALAAQMVADLAALRVSHQALLDETRRAHNIAVMQ